MRLWKRFDDACNEAHKVVEAWLDKVKAEAAEHKAQRLALIEEVKAWAADNRTAKDDDWKGFNRILHQFDGRWRDAGHLSEKAFAELQPQWKEAIQAAAAPLEAVQKQSLERRHAMIDEAKVLGAAPQLRVDAVKALAAALAGRGPGDSAGSQARAKAVGRLPQADRRSLQPQDRRAREGRGGAERSRSHRAGRVQGAGGGQCHRRRAEDQGRDGGARSRAARPGAGGSGGCGRRTCALRRLPPRRRAAEAPASAAAGAGASEAASADASAAEGEAQPAGANRAAPPEARAQAGDRHAWRRPARHEEVRARCLRAGAASSATARADPAASSASAATTAVARGEGRFGGGRFGDRSVEDRGPRLGDVAFRAQREALEHAQLALKKLAAQAHGEALTQLMTAWEQRIGRAGAQPAGTGQGGDAGRAQCLGQGAWFSARRRCVRGLAAAGDRGRSADAGRASGCTARAATEAAHAAQRSVARADLGRGHGAGAGLGLRRRARRAVCRSVLKDLLRR